MGKNGKNGRKEIVNQTQEVLLAQILLVLTSALLTGATAISTQWLGQTWRKCVWGHVVGAKNILRTSWGRAVSSWGNMSVDELS